MIDPAHTDAAPTARTPIDAYRASLPPGRLEGFRIDAIDRLGVPTFCTTFWPQSGPSNGGNGYGTTGEAAETGAMGELLEVVSANRAIARMPRLHGSYGDLAARLGVGAVLDPRTACLDAGSRFSPELWLEWVPARRYPGGETVWVPLELAACQDADLPPGDHLIAPITNGLGAGLNRAQALCHGLLELIQRDGNGLRFRALDAGVAIDLDVVASPETRALLARLDAEGVEVLVKLASTEFEIANVYVVGTDRPGRETGAPIVGTACGEAADPSRERALRKALLEFAAARARKAFTHGPLDAVERITPAGYLERFRRVAPAPEEPRALEEMVRWLALDAGQMRALLADNALSVRERVPFSALPDAPALSDHEARLATVAGKLHAAGFEVLYLDFSPRTPRGPSWAAAAFEPADAGISVVKAIVPGLEVETMSYGRIGERNVRRLRAMGSALVGLDAAPPGARPIVLADAAYERLGGRPWLDWQAVLRAVGPLYPLYREPGRHSAPVALERGAVAGSEGRR